MRSRRSWSRILRYVGALVSMLAVGSVGACAAGAQTSPNARLVKAVEEDDLKSAQTALDQGAAPDATLDNSPVSCTAAYHGQAALLKALLDHGARLDARTYPDKMTLLMFAALSGNSETVQLLLDRKVKINLQNELGETALMLVREPPIRISDRPGAPEPPSKAERAAILGMLLRAGADKEKVDITGRTALIRYAYYGVLSGVEALTEAKAKINARDRAGNTALILAAGWQVIDKALPTEEYLPIVKLLLKQGADRTVKNRAGVTALLAATQQDHKDIMALLLDRSVGANTNK
jgi:ankyrin repeat protein